MTPSLDAALRALHRHPWIVSHRGDWTRLPENSVAAMHSAARLGADMVEIDARAVADGTLVVIHDDSLDRTTNASGPVAALTAADLPALRLREGAGDGAPLTDHPLPRLAELLEAARGRVLVNIDTKHRRDLDAVCDLVLRMGMEDHVLVKMVADGPDGGAEFARAPWFGRLAFMPVILDAPRGGLGAAVERAAAATRPRIVEVMFDDLDELRDLAARLSARGVGLWTNTLDPVHALDLSDSRALEDPAQVWDVLLGAGVRAIQTDRAEALALRLGRAPSGPA
jgi:glycerophosphoryl diester phosphodiesterase